MSWWRRPVEVMAAGLEIILGDEQVFALNVFGGITACDAVADGIVEGSWRFWATQRKPWFVRLDAATTLQVPHPLRGEPPAGGSG